MACERCRAVITRLRTMLFEDQAVVSKLRGVDRRSAAGRALEKREAMVFRLSELLRGFEAS